MKAINKYCKKPFSTVASLILIAAVWCAPTYAMIYHPSEGAMWDPSVLYYDGKYYAFMMYDKTGQEGPQARHCFLATSEDGVHWKDEGTVVQEREEGCRFFKCFVGRCGDKFIMDHGVLRPQGQDTLRFYQSADLKNWEYLSSSQPDMQWYVRPGRWDHMYILPKEEGNPAAGYWGYVVSVPKESVDLPGMMQSKDGTTWEVLPPAKADWGDTPPRNHFEYGGCERIAGKYYLIGGTGQYMGSEGYSMFTMVADNPRGPFRPDVEAFRLCGTGFRNSVAWLAAWARGKDGELLISNYASPTSDLGHPWMLPLRKAVVDSEGHLRMGWWKGNEALKGESLSLNKNMLDLNGEDKPEGYDIVYLDTTFNPAQGIVLEGKIKARPVGNAPSAGFVLKEGPEQATAVQLGIGKPKSRETHIGWLNTPHDGTPYFQSEDVTGKGCATVTGIEPDREHTFRLLIRLDFFELYIDNLLMQTYRYNPGEGKVGFLVRNAAAEIRDLKAWKMSLPVVPDFQQKLRDKTLIAWVTPANLNQQGGSVLTIENPGDVFDAIDFGDVSPGRWNAGSDNYSRTQKKQNQYPVETADATTSVQIAVVYRGREVIIYRNAKEYARYNMSSSPAVFSDKSTVLIGRRHITAGHPCYFAGTIDDARIYGSPLSAEQIASLKPNQPSNFKPLAWWDFNDDKAEDKMKTFPTAKLLGGAKIAEGKLHLDGWSACMVTPPDAAGRIPLSPAEKSANQVGSQGEGEKQNIMTYQPMFFIPKMYQDKIWGEPGLMIRDGIYYLIYDFWNHRIPFYLATSQDGVHWREEGPVMPVEEDVDNIECPSIHRFDANGPYIMQYAVTAPGYPSFRIRFALSDDLRTWVKLGPYATYHPDPRWYTSGRWDTQYAAPAPDGQGYFALWNGEPKNVFGLAIGKTQDGLHWETLPPVEVRLPVPGPKLGACAGEIGGFHRIGDRYFLILPSYLSGKYEPMVLTSRDPSGPYEVTKCNPVLSIHPCYYLRSYRLPDNTIVAFESVLLQTDPTHQGRYWCLPPFKQVVCSGEDIWLKWWPRNENAKVTRIDLDIAASAGKSGWVDLLPVTFDLDRGIVLEGLCHPTADGETDLARNAKPSASQTAECGNMPGSIRPENAVDELPDTFWESAGQANEPDFYELDLGQTQRVGRVELQWLNRTSTNLEQSILQLSEDGKSWHSVGWSAGLHTPPGPSLGYRICLWSCWQDLNREARYVRVMLPPHSGAGMGIWEISVYMNGRRDLGNPEHCAPGILIECEGDDNYAILLEKDGTVRFGFVGKDGRGFRTEIRRKLQVEMPDIRRFRLLMRLSLGELYLDDFFISSFKPGKPTGWIGVIHGGKGESVRELQAWYSDPSTKGVGK